MMTSIENIITEKKYPKILLLFGEEEFLLEEAYEKILRFFISEDKSYSESEIKDAEVHSQSDIINSCNIFPFISKRRVVTVNNFEKLFSGRISKKTEQSSPFANYLKSPQDTTILILKANIKKLNGLSSAFESKTNKAKAEKIINSSGFPYHTILTKYDWIEFPKIWENQLPSWVIRRFKSKSKNITPEAASMLVMYTNPNLRDLNSEIDKILLFVADRKEITSDDINFLIGENRDYNVYELQKSIGKRDLALSLKILENMLATDRKEMLIMTVLINYFTALFKLIEESVLNPDRYKLAASLGVNPMFVSEYLATLKLYSPDEIERAFQALTEADAILKSTSTDSLYIMQKMLIRIMDKK
ncbi:DNA polymerase III subunit delta [Bacteroidetes/Chlorobi group bacterium ChocPot_Mid]|jgi:DNA polymerase-3 subunit delta|nr:MAG: DNA polymerase III subunit delta [Bacteroidetes/Chlorobi group bacterium ChocPot_Mid]